MGKVWFDDPEEPGWPNCATPDCPNKVCTWASNTLCFKCCEWQVGKPWMIAQYEATHNGMTWEEAMREDDD